MIDTHRRGNFFQLFDRRVAGRLGDDKIRLRRGDGFNIDIGGADECDVGIIKIDARQHAAGAQKMAAVRSGSAMAGNRRYAKLDQRNGDIQVVQGHNPLRVNRHHHFAVQVVSKRLRWLCGSCSKTHQHQHCKKYAHFYPLKSIPTLPEQQQEKRSANQ